MVHDGSYGWLFQCTGRSSGCWFFRVTKEQYDELSEPYWEAYYMSEEKIKGVTYTYEELFGEK